MASTPSARSEIAIQSLFRSRARILCPAVRLVAIPNGGKRGQKALNQLRREGAAWGFPDMMVLAPGKVAFLEFKAPTGTIKPNQADWLDDLHAMGFPCGVFRCPDKAIAFLRDHGFPFLSTEAHRDGHVVADTVGDMLRRFA